MKIGVILVSCAFIIGSIAIFAISSPFATKCDPLSLLENKKLLLNTSPLIFGTILA